MQFDLRKNWMWIVIIVGILLFGLVFFGIHGLRFGIGLLLFTLPGYFAFRKLKFSPEESACYGFFTSIGIVSGIVYYVGFVIPFAWAVYASLILLLFASLYLLIWGK
ncbi:hypothetical protein J4464_01760 [Candidatus Woesearchaeota archaeon]|nr:hypothetical protein [uncultured archaeon]MBS3142091.1 hypothetical protein [Candidatus Woesearchaeota archaeon]